MITYFIKTNNLNNIIIIILFMKEEMKTQPVLKCVNCDEYLIIEKLNCGIFRHGVFKSNQTQIHPHESKDKCADYIKKDLIYGCGKPFKVSLVNNIFVIEKCDYI